MSGILKSDLGSPNLHQGTIECVSTAKTGALNDVTLISGPGGYQGKECAFWKQYHLHQQQDMSQSSD